MWSRDGRELFYVEGGQRMMSVRIDREPSFTPGTPEVVFEGPYAFANPLTRNYDLHPDGQRFLMIKRGGASTIDLVLVQNWFEELKRLVDSAD